MLSNNLLSITSYLNDNDFDKMIFSKFLDFNNNIDFIIYKKDNSFYIKIILNFYSNEEEFSIDSSIHCIEKKDLNLFIMNEINPIFKFFFTPDFILNVTNGINTILYSNGKVQEHNQHIKLIKSNQKLFDICPTLKLYLNKGEF